ncbi:MAG TPA: fibronectin type III domain-containing protein [Candidatus Thermoplasmatota archaeon]|nr:fibronectin type III domain-containing protein [Candidatus Thermoplasmatota archaeon]
MATVHPLLNTALAASLLSGLALAPAASAELGPYLPPQNLRWFETGPSTVELAWDPPLDADAATTYNVYRGDELLVNTEATAFVGEFTGITLFRVVAVHPAGQARTGVQSTLPTQAVGTDSLAALAIVGAGVCPPAGVSIIFPELPWVAPRFYEQCIPP